MHCNAKKGNILSVCSSTNPLIKFYEIDGNILEQVESAKYHGATIHESLEFSDHVRETVSKANKRLGFLKWNLKGCPVNMTKLAYISLVHSGLEYGAAVWDPHLGTHKKATERVQNQAIRWPVGYGARQMCSITNLWKELKLQTLEERRRQLRLSFL